MRNYCDCETVDINIKDCDINAKIYEIKNNVSERPPLENTDIVVAGGRGLGDKKN